MHTLLAVRRTMGSLHGPVTTCIVSYKGSLAHHQCLFLLYPSQGPADYYLVEFYTSLKLENQGLYKV